MSEAARLLSITQRSVQRLAARGELTLTARGLIDRASLDQHLATRQGVRTRAWSSETAWAATALLSGARADWLGPAQRSRLVQLLRDTEAPALVSRVRNRAQVRRYAGHRSTAARLRDEDVVTVDAVVLGLAGETGRFNGYVAADALSRLTTRHALVEDPHGAFTLRVTDFDLNRVAALAHAGRMPVLAALDSAEALDPRERGVAMDVLTQALGQFRG